MVGAGVVHGRPARDDVGMSRRHVPAGSMARGSDPVLLTADEAGWRYSGLRVLAFADGETRTVATGDTEVFLLPLSARGVTVEIDGDTFRLEGRPSVFARVTDFLYAGRDTELTITCEEGGEIAVPSAKCDHRLPARYGAAEDVAVEIRGAGPATRQVTNFGSPEAWSHADRLMCVELLTPDGNWSSYPPHKHDDSPECPVNNEEIYYFRIGVAGSIDYAPRRLRPASHVHRRRPHRRQPHRGGRRRLPDPPRLPRAVRRRAGVHDVLPERARRPGRRSLDGVLRRSGPSLGARSRGSRWRPIRVVR